MTREEILAEIKKLAARRTENELRIADSLEGLRMIRIRERELLHHWTATPGSDK